MSLAQHRSDGKKPRHERKRDFAHTPKCKNLIGIYRTLSLLETQCGFVLDSVLDIGANSGIWSKELKIYFPGADFFLIEGSILHEQSLLASGLPFHISVVGDENKDVIFYQKEGDTGNSIFRQYNWKKSDPSNIVRTKMFTIDSILENRNITTKFKFLKIDVQGGEVLALKGARNTLESVEVITVEASIMNYNVGGASFLDLYHTLDSFGFALYDMFDMMRREGFLVQIDLLFVRKSSSLWLEKCTGIRPAQ